MATAFALCSGPIAGACSLGKGRVLVSVQGDGVSCYDVNSQKPVLSWALGGTEQEFSSAAVYDYDTNLLFAPLRPRGGGGKSGSVLAWSADDTVGTITALASPLHLQPLHSVFPLSGAPEGEAAEAAAAAAEDAEAAQVDGSGKLRAGAVAVFAAGGAALCANNEVVAEVEEARGQHTVAAAFQPAPFEARHATQQAQQQQQHGTLVLIHSDPRQGTVSASTYHVSSSGSQLEAAGPAVALAPPAAGARAVAAAATPARTAVMWSDGTVAIYAIPGDRRPLGSAPGMPAGPGVPVAQRRLAGFAMPASRQQQAKGSGGAGRKRGAGGESDAAAGGVGMAAVGDKQVAVAGWASASDGTAVLRLVVLETSAGCVQLAQDFTAADVGLAALDSSKPVQVAHLGGASKQVAISLGTAVLVATLTELKPPTLANLLGALALDKAALALRQGGSGSSSSAGGGKDALLALAAPAHPPLGAGAAAVNPAALAAARVLHEDEQAALCSPFGGAARPMDLRLALQAAAEPGQWLVPATEVGWGPADAAADEQMGAEERRVWQAVATAQGGAAPAALASDAALQKAVAPLLELRRSTGLPLSPRLVSCLLLLAAEHHHWGAAAAVLAAQPPSLLGDVPGLAAAAAEGGQFEFLEQLLGSCSDVPAAELAALLRVLLAEPSTAVASAGRQTRLEAARAAAVGAATAAEAAAGQHGTLQPPAVQQQQQQDGAPGKAGRRRRRRGGSSNAAGDSEDEDATALAAAAAGSQADAEMREQEQPGEGAAAGAAEHSWVHAPGAREAAVAACCSAAVEGFEAADVCLHAVVALGHRPGVLADALRGLAAAHAVRLLRYLATLLRNLTTLVGAQLDGWLPPLVAPPRAAPLPRMAQALAWANAALDANIVTLSLEPQAAPLLQELGTLVEAEVADTRPLLRLAGLVEHALLQRPLPQSGAGTYSYSIQWLDLRIQPAEQ